MNIGDRIQNLRKSKGLSQEELADQIGVSRQAVSKWESEQSAPDIEKIIRMSDFFQVTTDYLIKGIESNALEEKCNRFDARIFTTIGTALDYIGLVVAIMIWIERRTPVSVAIGLIIMTIGCMFHIIGQTIGENKVIARKYFILLNVWPLLLMPVSCIFNFIDGMTGGFWWTFTPIPHLGNSYRSYFLCWFLYVILCLLVDSIAILYSKRYQK